MTDYSESRSLDDAAARCKMPISVWYEETGQEWLSGEDGWVVSLRGDPWEHHCSPSQSAAGLKRAYLSLVAELQHAGGER